MRHAEVVERSSFRERVPERFSRLYETRVERLVDGRHRVCEWIRVRPFDSGSNSYLEMTAQIVDVLHAIADNLWR
jgi:hypothetical protein